MKKIKLVSAFSLVLGTFGLPSAQAAIGALSRANCVGFVNESVTYDRPALTPFFGNAGGTHIAQGDLYPLHYLQDGQDGRSDWRFYAGDTDDSAVVTVYGAHGWYFLDANGGITGNGATSTEASDCNLTEW
ncbi:hypothetical protein HF319_05730 [Xanthomonas sp. Kuri4-1]